jgi:hypothetical protein
VLKLQQILKIFNWKYAGKNSENWLSERITQEREKNKIIYE